MMIRTKMLLLLMICLTTSFQNIKGQNEIHNLAQKVDSIMGYVEGGISPGSAISIVKDGKTLLNKGYGYSSLEYSKKIDLKTSFDIASLSKQFTAFAVAMLIEEGKISLNDDVRKYIPELNDFGQVITIDHLIHHVSGIRDWTGTLTMAGWNYDDRITFDQILRMAFNQKELNFEPGTEFQYSNTGYNLLAEIIQRITKLSFRTWTTENIFSPLGMKNTFFLDDLSEVVPNKAFSYHKDKTGVYHVDVVNTISLGASSLNTTIEDISKWLINLQDKKIGGQNVFDRIFQTTSLKDGSSIAYAYGFWVGTYRNTKWVDHTGGWESFRTYLTHFPDKNISIAILNNNNEGAFSKGLEIANLFIFENTETKVKNSEIDNKIIKLKPVLKGNSEDFSGIYKFGPAWYLKVKYIKDTLYGLETGESILPILVDELGNYSTEELDHLSFIRSANGLNYNIEYNGKTREKVGSISEKPYDCIGYTGRYFSEELKTEYEVVFDQETECINLLHFRRGKIKLTRAWNDDFLTEDWLTKSISFIRDDSNVIIGFTGTENGARNQFFTKK